MTTTSPKATVYYNSACPVCDAGVCSMRDRLPDGSVEWVDVHKNPETLKALGLGLEDVRERLHLVAEDGGMHVGIDALAATLRKLPRWGWLAAPLQWRLVRPLAGFLYNRFARQLYRWNRRRGHW